MNNATTTAGTTGTTEVLPDNYAMTPPPLQIGRVSFSRATTLESPFFWLLLGASAVLLVQWYCDQRR